MASYQARQRDPLVDPNTQVMLERRGRELLGVGLVLIALLFAALLGSYSPLDPGWMAATEEPARNMLGHFGASVASTLIILVGKGAWTIPTIFFAWGLRFALHKGEDRAVSRIVFAVIAVALGSVFATTHVPGPDWQEAFSLGGLFGDTISGALLGVAPVKIGLGMKLLSFVSGVAFIAMLLFVTGFDKYELRVIWRFLLIGLIKTYAQITALVGRGAVGTAQAAAAMQERRRQSREATAAMQQSGVTFRAADWDAPDEPVVEKRRSFLSRAEPVVAEPSMQPQPMRARGALVADDRSAQSFGKPASMRAMPRHAEPPMTAQAAPVAPVAAPPQKLGLLARLRRAAEPQVAVDFEPEDLSHLPPEDRIKARITDVIRSRVRHGAGGLAQMTPVQAAVARREPGLGRLRGPQPLVAGNPPCNGIAAGTAGCRPCCDGNDRRPYGCPTIDPWPATRPAGRLERNRRLAG